MRLPSLFALLAAVSLATPAAADSLPKFSDFPVPVYAGKPAKPRLATPDLRDRRATYVAAAEGQVDAGGRYIVVKLPCGAACAQPTLLDARSGRIVELFTISGCREVRDDFDPVMSRADSRMIVFSGRRNEEGINGLHFYLIGDGGRLTHLRSLDTDGNFETAPKVE